MASRTWLSTLIKNGSGNGTRHGTDKQVRGPGQELPGEAGSAGGDRPGDEAAPVLVERERHGKEAGSHQKIQTPGFGIAEQVAKGEAKAGRRNPRQPE